MAGYEQQILRILSHVGERGISVSALAKQVYNLSSTLFFQPNLTDIHRQVQQYLLRNSKSAQQMVERMERRGYYRLNTGGSADARQLMLEFSEEQEKLEPGEPAKPQQDLSLNLFDFSNE